MSLHICMAVFNAFSFICFGGSSSSSTRHDDSEFDLYMNVLFFRYSCNAARSTLPNSPGTARIFLLVSNGNSSPRRTAERPSVVDLTGHRQNNFVPEFNC